MKNPVARHMHKSNKPSVIEDKYEEKFLEILDKELNDGYIEPIPNDLLERMEEIRNLAQANKEKE